MSQPPAVTDAQADAAYDEFERIKADYERDQGNADKLVAFCNAYFRFRAVYLKWCRRHAA